MTYSAAKLLVASKAATAAHGSLHVDALYAVPAERSALYELTPGVVQYELLHSVEVKSLSGRERNSVRISSEDQLEALTSSLYLAVYRLSEMPESDKSISLNELVETTESELDDALGCDFSNTFRCVV